MNLENIKHLLRTFFIPVVFLLTIIFIGVWLIAGRDKPAEEKFGELAPIQIDSVLREDLEIKNISAGLRISKTPKIVNVFKRGMPVSINTIAKKLGLAKKPKKIGTNQYWEEKNKILKFNPSTFQMNYSFRSGKTSGDLTEKKAQTKAEEFLSGLSLIDKSTQLNLVEINRLVTVGRDEPEVARDNNFDTYSILFEIDLDGLSVINENGITSVVKIWVGLDGEIRKLDASTQSYTTTDKSTYKVKTAKDVRGEVDGQEVTVVNIKGNLPLTHRKVTINYSQGGLVYLLTSKGKYIQPFYLLSGFAVGDVIRSSTILGLVPALEN